MVELAGSPELDATNRRSPLTLRRNVKSTAIGGLSDGIMWEQKESGGGYDES